MANQQVLDSQETFLKLEANLIKLMFSKSRIIHYKLFKVKEALPLRKLVLKRRNLGKIQTQGMNMIKIAIKTLPLLFSIWMDL